MDQETQTEAHSSESRSLQCSDIAIGAVLTVALIALMCYRVHAKLVIDSYSIPDFPHQFLVPVFAACMVWTENKVVAYRLPFSSESPMTTFKSNSFGSKGPEPEL